MGNSENRHAIKFNAYISYNFSKLKVFKSKKTVICLINC
jgi:hypothetical protein